VIRLGGDYGSAPAIALAVPVHLDEPAAVPHRSHQVTTLSRGPRTAWLPAAFVIGSIGLWEGGRLVADLAQAPAARESLWISESRLDDGRGLLLVVDQGTRHAALYHVDAAVGTLTLKSTRDLTWDLMVGDFNAQEPKPSALQKMLRIPAAPPPR